MSWSTRPWVILFVKISISLPGHMSSKSVSSCFGHAALKKIGCIQGNIYILKLPQVLFALRQSLKSSHHQGQGIRDMTACLPPLPRGSPIDLLKNQGRSFFQGDLGQRTVHQFTSYVELCYDYNIPSHSGVLITPGATPLTRMPNLASRLLKERINPFMACFAAT